MFYVYEWYIKNTNEIIYVGKGTRNRYLVRKHNSLFNYIVNEYDCSSRIIKQFEKEEDAFRYEFERVCELKQIGQCKCNINKAGGGGSIKWWTPEMREYYSANNVMKSQQQRERMSKSNPMKNPKIAKKVANSKSRPVVLNGIEYKSIKEAKEKTGYCVDTIQKWCINGKNSSGQICYYKDGKIIHYKKHTR